MHTQSHESEGSTEDLGRVARDFGAWIGHRYQLVIATIAMPGNGWRLSSSRALVLTAAVKHTTAAQLPKFYTEVV